MPREQMAGVQQEMLSKAQKQKGDLPLDGEETKEIIASAEKSNPVFLSLDKLLSATADALGKEMGVEVAVKI